MKHPTIQESILNMMAFHDGQLDKSGVPYFSHPLRVMLRIGIGDECAAHHAALLHDVMEDCDVTRLQLLDLGYSEEVVEMVELLTHITGNTYRDYIRRIMASGNTGAQLIKLADLYDNSGEIRREGMIKEVREKFEAMVEERYVPAIFQLKLVLGDAAKKVCSEDMEVSVSVDEAEEDISGS